MILDGKNYWAEVARMLGVELGEKVNIITDDEGVFEGSFKIDEKGFSGDDNIFECSTAILYALLDGRYTIKKLPWKPKPQDRFYSLETDGMINTSMFNPCLASHIMCYKFGNCFRTAEEAERNKERVVEMLNSDKPFEW